MDDPQETERRMGDLVRLGKVVGVQLDPPRVRLQVGELETHWIRWGVMRAGDVRIWSPPIEGEQMLVFTPEGDIERAVVLGSYFSDDMPPPAADPRHLVWFNDGAQISYELAAHSLAAAVPAEGSIALTGGGCILSMVDGVMTLKADEIVTDGVTRLNNGTSAVATRGSTTTRGDTINDGAEGVFA
jgi:phage baseplate assembly protein V